MLVEKNLYNRIIDVNLQSHIFFEIKATNKTSFKIPFYEERSRGAEREQCHIRCCSSG
jgi:hypothetical protein